MDQSKYLPYIPTGVRTFGPMMRKYAHPHELQLAIDQYFDMCERGKKPYTISGLQLGLGISSGTMKRMMEMPDYAELIEYARQIIVEQVESKLLEGQVQPQGLMFWLKNKADYVDKTEIEHSGDIGIAKAIQEARQRVRERLAADESDNVIDIETKMTVTSEKVALHGAG